MLAAPVAGVCQACNLARLPKKGSLVLPLAPVGLEGGGFVLAIHFSWAYQSWQQAALMHAGLLLHVMASVSDETVCLVRRHGERYHGVPSCGQ